MLSFHKLVVVDFLLAVSFMLLFKMLVVNFLIVTNVTYRRDHLTRA